MFLVLIYHSFTFTHILNFATSFKEECVKMWYCFYTQILVFCFVLQQKLKLIVVSQIVFVVLYFEVTVLVTAICIVRNWTSTGI